MTAFLIESKYCSGMDSNAVARFFAIPTTFMVSGYSIAASQSSVPLVLDQPAAVSTQVFKGVFYRGAMFVAPMQIISAVASGYLAYTIPEQRTTLAAAAGLSIASLPWTQVVMKKGIDRLLEIGESATELAKADQTGEVTRLLSTWILQNWVRASLSFSGGIVALWAWYSFNTKKHAA